MRKYILPLQDLIEVDLILAGRLSNSFFAPQRFQCLRINSELGFGFIATGF